MKKANGERNTNVYNFYTSIHVYIYICYTYTHTYIHTYLLTYLHTYMQIHTSIHPHICTIFAGLAEVSTYAVPTCV